jgi:hypothetical protein
VTHRKALERWETTIGNCEVTPQVIWPIVKSLIKRDGPKAPTAVHGPLGLNYQPLEKATRALDHLEHQFAPHDLCDKKHKGLVEARVQALLEVAVITPFGKRKTL